MFSSRAAYQNATYAAAALACTGPNGPPTKVFLSIICSVISTRGCGLARTTPPRGSAPSPAHLPRRLIGLLGLLAPLRAPARARPKPSPRNVFFFINYLLCNFNVGLWLGPDRATSWQHSKHRSSSEKARWPSRPSRTCPCELRRAPQRVNALSSSLSSLFCVAATNCPIRWAHRTTQQAPRRPRL